MFRCSKCGGRMFLEREEDFYHRFLIWRCLNCGAMVDRTILDNRRYFIGKKKRRAIKYENRFAVVTRVTRVKSGSESI